MTEHDWLTNDQALELIDWTQIPSSCAGRPWSEWAPSDRQLRLFAVASARLRPSFQTKDPAWLESIRIAEEVADGAPMPERRPKTIGGADLGPTIVEAVMAARCMSAFRGDPFKGEGDLLRDIFGNPFRPVKLPLCHRCSGDGKAHGSDRPFEATEGNPLPGRCPTCDGRKSPVVTAEVYSLATAAYKNRSRKCTDCHVTGNNGYHVRDEHITTTPEEFCPPCDGTGTVDDGTLDTFSLAMLADALEESGFPAYDLSQCNWCDGVGWYNELGPNTFSQTCYRCDGEGTLKTYSTLLHHLRSPGPHVRGCWALDIVLGSR
jgi:hypothetical protein